VGVGADLEPGTLLAAYRSGLFPMHVELWDERRLGWWSPDPRGVLPLDDLRVTRSLRRSLQRFTITVDTDLDAVMAACSRVDDAYMVDAGQIWIDPSFRDAYRTLFDLGWVHSVEVRDDDGALVGGLYGVAIGGLFAGESMFHRARDASKAALVALVDLLGADGDDRRLLDVQWATEHLASMGAIEIPRTAYLALLDRALQAPPAPGWSVDYDDAEAVAPPSTTSKARATRPDA
jgi:leucyl/phenylalanyl-tRNA--protein transferase